VNLVTGDLSGCAWGANLGWISLGGVRTTVLSAGPDSDGDGIPDPWEMRMTGGLTALAGGAHDADGDGVCDIDEYGADTDPLDGQSRLAFTAFSRSSTTNRLTWTVEQTRFYELWRSPTLSTNDRSPTGLGVMVPDAGATMTREVDTAPPAGPPPAAQFYRVKAVIPLGE